MSASTSARSSASRSTGSRGCATSRRSASTCVGHPRRQQRQRPIRLPDDEMLGAGVTLYADDRDDSHRRAGETDRRSEPQSPDTRQYDAGSTGTGKTHLAVAIARPRDPWPRLFGAVRAVPHLGPPSSPKGMREGRLEGSPVLHFSKPKLLIIDELGYLPFEAECRAPVLPTGISSRYESGSMLITSNRAVGEWGTVFRAPDRGDRHPRPPLLHHSHVITIRGDSYRLRDKRRSGLFKAPAVAETAAAAPA